MIPDNTLLIYVDIDETICNTPSDRDYSKSTPIQEMIDKINSMYDMGHTIVYWTARGFVSKIDFTQLTKKQLKEWGCKYHRIETLAKPHYDILIDDKTINPLTTPKIDIGKFISDSNNK